MIALLFLLGPARAAGPPTLATGADHRVAVEAAFGLGAGTGPLRPDGLLAATLGPGDGRVAVGGVVVYRAVAPQLDDAKAAAASWAFGARGAWVLGPTDRRLIEPSLTASLGAEHCPAATETARNGCIRRSAPAWVPWARGELGARIHLVKGLDLPIGGFADVGAWSGPTARDSRWFDYSAGLLFGVEFAAAGSK